MAILEEPRNTTVTISDQEDGEFETEAPLRFILFFLNPSNGNGRLHSTRDT